MSELRKLWFVIAGFLLFGWGISPAQNISDSTKIKSMLDMALEKQGGNQDSALILATAAYHLSRNCDFKFGIASACMRMGNILYTKGENDTALACFRKALKIRKSLKDYKGASVACVMMSYIFSTLGKKDSAFAVLFQSLRLNNLSKDSSNLVYTYISLGNLYLDYGSLQSGLQYYRRAESLAKIMNNQTQLSLVYGGLGNYYFKTSRFKDALSFFMKKEIIDRNVKDPFGHAQVMCNIALCYDQLHEHKKALQFYHVVVSDYKHLRMRSDEAHVYFNMGCLFINNEMADSAIFYINKALVLAKETQDQNREVDCYEALSDAYALKMDYHQAYRYYLQFSDLNDSLLNREKIMCISEMQTKYETEKKEQQIKLLDAENKTRSSQRNLLFFGTILLVLLAVSILYGLVKTTKERKKSDDLLLNILPSTVADELKSTGSAEAKYFEQVTVMFTDFKNFTMMSETLNAKDLVDQINYYYSAFDKIITKHGLEKIKTIGDSYMCAGGVPVPNTTNALSTVFAAMEIMDFMRQEQNRSSTKGKPFFEIRIGCHTGPVIAGIVGLKKFAYDIWGDTVNVASRMESTCEPGKVNISGTTFEFVKERFKCTYRGKIKAKNKGDIDMYFVEQFA